MTQNIVSKLVGFSGTNNAAHYNLSKRAEYRTHNHAQIYSKIACWRLVMFAEGKIVEKRSVALRTKTSTLSNFSVVCKHWPTLLHGDSSHPLLSTIVSTHSRRRLEEVNLKRLAAALEATTNVRLHNFQRSRSI